MRLEEALQISGGGGARERNVQLICGFTPLHFQTFLKAYLRLRFPEDSNRVQVGLYGDLEGNLDRAQGQSTEGAIVVIEWADLDQRLGFRGAGGWRTPAVDDAITQAREKCSRLVRKFEALARNVPITLVSPTLPLPPLSHCSPVQAAKCELQLNAILGDFLLEASGLPAIRLLSATNLANASPLHTRYDVKMDLATGFPYSLSHADALARLAVACLFPSEPKKGLITDLDETLWKGILGDVGAQGVSWSIEDKSQVHALYQQLLDSLAESGVLLAIASKNELRFVNEALQRADLLVRPDTIYPVEAGWKAKSEAVGRILTAWNIGADSVVFVDDSAMELAEVAERFPQMECVLFRPTDPAAVLAQLTYLRELFGRAEIQEEDCLRAASLRSRVVLRHDEESANSEDFIARLQAKVTFEPADVNQKRAFDLVNKTNQFNLNGVRFTEAEWNARFARAGSFLTMVSYEDRFGPLGRIAVVGGYLLEGRCIVDIFVMSCRAFSRLIEFQVLRQLFEKSGMERIFFQFKPTDRNGPMQTFLGQLHSNGVAAAGRIEVSTEAFEKASPKLYHEVIAKWTI